MSEEADAILSVPLGSTQMEDSLLWHFEKTGIYTVRSGYKLGTTLFDRDNPSSSSVDEW